MTLTKRILDRLECELGSNHAELLAFAQELQGMSSVLKKPLITDTARLDALIAMRASVYAQMVGKGWVVVDETKRTRSGHVAKTLRAAIDAAILLPPASKA